MFTRSKGLVDKQALSDYPEERRRETPKNQGDNVELSDLEKSAESPSVASDGSDLTSLENQTFRDPTAIAPDSSHSSSSSTENTIHDITPSVPTSSPYILESKNHEDPSIVVANSPTLSSSQPSAGSVLPPRDSSVLSENNPFVDSSTIYSDNLSLTRNTIYTDPSTLLPENKGVSNLIDSLSNLSIVSSVQSILLNNKQNTPSVEQPKENPTPLTSSENVKLTGDNIKEVDFVKTPLDAYPSTHRITPVTHYERATVSQSVASGTRPLNTDLTNPSPLQRLTSADSRNLRKFFSPLNDTNSHTIQYFTPNPSGTDIFFTPSAGTSKKSDSRSRFTAKETKQKVTMDQISLGILRDAIKVIPEFNGTPESLNRYVTSLREASEGADPALDRYILTLAKGKLSSAVWNKISKITFHTVAEYITYLKKTFDPPRDVYQLTGELGSSYQRNCDNVDDYADRVRWLSEKILEAYQHKNGGVLDQAEKERVESMALNCFKRGLKPEIATAIKTETNLSNAINTAKDTERELADLKRLRAYDRTTAESRSQADIHVVETILENAGNSNKKPEDIQKSTDPETPVCQLCRKTGHTANKCPTLPSLQEQQTKPTCEHCRRIGHTKETCLTLARETSGQGIQICQFCNKRGHLADKCYSIPCRYCGRTGHLPDDCFRKQGPEGAQKPPANNPPAPNQSANPGGSQCFICRGWGHIASVCPSKPPNRNNQAQPGPSTLPNNPESQPPPIPSTYAQATNGAPPGIVCRYCKTPGHIIPNCPERYARYGPFVPNQGNGNSLPVTGGQAAQRPSPIFTLSGVSDFLPRMP